MKRNLTRLSDRRLARLVRQCEKEIVEIGGCGSNDIACIARCKETGARSQSVDHGSAS
jgi:hypothetical protein